MQPQENLDTTTTAIEHSTITELETQEESKEPIELPNLDDKYQKFKFVKDDTISEFLPMFRGLHICTPAFEQKFTAAFL